MAVDILSGLKRLRELLVATSFVVNKRKRDASKFKYAKPLLILLPYLWPLLLLLLVVVHKFLPGSAALLRRPSLRCSWALWPLLFVRVQDVSRRYYHHRTRRFPAGRRVSCLVPALSTTSSLPFLLLVLVLRCAGANEWPCCAQQAKHSGPPAPDTIQANQNDQRNI